MARTGQRFRVAEANNHSAKKNYILSISDLITSPYYQLILLTSVVLCTAIICRFNVEVVIGYGMNYFLVWMLASLVLEIFFVRSWTFLWQSMLVMVIYYAIWLVLSLIADKVSNIDAGQGFMLFLAMLNIYLVYVFIAVIAMGVISFYRWIFQ